MTLEQDETSHDNFDVCLHIEAKGNYYFLLIGDTSLSPKQWVKDKKKRGLKYCVNHPPDTQMETACTKTVRLWKRLPTTLRPNKTFNFYYIISVS